MGGPEVTFEQIYQTYRDDVFAYAFKRVQNRQAAEEITQDIFLKIHRFHGGYDPKQPIRGWLWTIVFNAVRDWIRKDGLDQSVPDEFEEDGPSLIERAPSSDPGAETRLMVRSERQRVMNRLRVLTVLQRKVVWLRFVHDLSLDEIGRELGTTLASIKCVLQRVRACWGMVKS